MKDLVLASTSPYRRAILERIGVPFQTANPDVDETPIANESPQALVERLAEAKARAVAEQFPTSLIIGSDQVAVLDGMILGKPGNHDKAFQQLTRAAGKQVKFFTGLCLYDAASASAQTLHDTFTVHFRALSEQQIERYLQSEQPYDCAGSFKSEGLGIALFTRLEGDDPNSLIGLPLIQLITLLNAQGVEIP